VADDRKDRTPGEISPEERAALKQRASDLGSRLETAKHRHDAPGRASRGEAMGRGMRIAAELIGGVVAGGAIGWFLDQWLGTKPWLFILFFLMGSAAGMLNIIRQAEREKTPPAPSVKDDEDDN
jgi:ATP synthase protein I